ncbi:hypothetical protein AN639_11595 [Candidatus Epulonipiscium fishelsonii]|uniref:Uncharacterized protein n=1 Tax=Candidatus Epulonipiscium fishelsonii TaxID=77094 RepID=A0ACC8XG87_9FIRM|nr:hypothetical protein AN396_01700 [Epulopiscium sp. SCG-B11WGA-EpuloA1]ONI42955.1 hypothetical protein AN639_11595 [Epulopiscium sp. SCG-B05WGA-EpuloA1]
MSKRYKLFSFILCILVIIGISEFIRTYSSFSIFNAPKILKSNNYIQALSSVAINEDSSQIRLFEIPLQNQQISSGVIGVPASNNNPIVFILHDLNYTQKPYDHGFTYLVKHLADNGYLTISLNISSTFDFKSAQLINIDSLRHLVFQHLYFLDQSISNNKLHYSLDLSNKGNLNQISLIGHGVGGFGAYSLSNSSEINFHSALLISPTFISSAKSIIVPSLPLGIILPQLDGEVKSLDGQKIYDTLSISNELIDPISNLFLKNANHNYFNTMLSSDDSIKLKYNYDKINKLTPLEQQEFLKNYTLDFLNYYHFNPSNKNIGLNSSLIAPDSIYGFKVLTSLCTPNSLGILTPSSNNSTTLNSLGGEISMNNASLNYVVESYMAPHDSAIGFQQPGLPENLGLFKVSWNVSSGTFSTKIPESSKDISKYNALSLWISIDPMNSLNIEPLSFIIQFKDKFGKIDQILIDSNSIALQQPDGETISNAYQTQWSTFTPLSNIRIPLSLLTNISKTNLSSLSIKFNQINSGAILLGNISFLK